MNKLICTIRMRYRVKIHKKGTVIAGVAEAGGRNHSVKTQETIRILVYCRYGNSL